MAGTVVMAGMLGCTAILAVGLTLAGGADVASRRAATSADTAALAAADTASGLVPGADPCTRAALVAQAAGSVLAACRVDGLTVTVRVEVPVGSLRATAGARAGPPPTP